MRVASATPYLPSAVRSRTLALDLGKARVGVAVDDDLGLMAHPRGVLPAKDRGALLRSIAKIAADENAGRIVVGLPVDMRFELVEPLRSLFKDEVRAVGEELGLPEEIVWRQPFPGPGLAVRIIGEVTPERAEILRAADAIVTDEIRRAGLYRQLWQSFAVLPAVRTVGVMGDGRTYAYPIVIRAVTSDDAMTADWARLPYDLLERLSSRIINEVDGVNRVALDITSKPPGTIEWE